MNATKRFLTGAAIAAGALGIGAGAFFACQQELSPGAESEAAGAERRPGDAKYDDGNYDFYFRNGSHIYGDCDGYNSEPGGKTTIYEYWKSAINKWEKRLKSAGINPEVYRTSKTGKYCWVRFDSDLLIGIGWEGRGYNCRTNDEVDIKIGDTLLEHFAAVEIQATYYAPAHGTFNNEIHYYNDFIKMANEFQRKSNNGAVLFVLDDNVNPEKHAKQLRDAGAKVIMSAKYDDTFWTPFIVVNADSISWFAYNTARNT